MIYDFIKLDINVRVITIPIESYKENFFHIIKILLEKNIFMSLTISSEEISLILDEKYLSFFGKKDDNCIVIDRNIYNVYQVFNTDGSDIEYIGIVNKISSIFKEKELPILYINSFNNNFILVSDEYDISDIMCSIQKSL